MQTFYKKGICGFYRTMLIVCVIFITQIGNIFAEGTKQLAPTANDSLFLAANDDDFGDFASVMGPEISRLNFKIIDNTTEKLYLGLSPRVGGGGAPSTAVYFFQIRDSLTNMIMHGPFEVNGATANIMNSGPLNNGWLQASSGPIQMNPMGYDTASVDDRWVFQPPTNGTYFIEFFDGNSIINIPYFDFTVASNITTEIQGRIWSQNWALRTPQMSAMQVAPDCQWDREFNGVFYTFTENGFVSKIDFQNSGLQGLSFNVAFGARGPGTTGNIIGDRQSIQGLNATANAAEHMAFLNEPDPNCFVTPPNNCGTAELVRVECIMDSFCIFITTTLPGQVEIILDFAFDNGFYDADTTDVILALQFLNSGDTMCIGWNGLKGDGSAIDPNVPLPAILRYTQGVQHYAAFDLEFLKNGFCVETVRPICPGLETNRLYWDDSQISDALNTFTIDESEPGTGQPQTQINGCDCGVAGCRTWDNFQTGDTPAQNAACQGQALGYGDMNTMNTWWFAALTQSPVFSLPVVNATIAGDSTVCDTDSTQFIAIATPDDVTISYTYTWDGPTGFTSTTNSTGMIGTAGEYCVTVTNPESNCMVVVCKTLIVNDNPTASSVINCVGASQQTANIDVTAAGGMGPYTYEWMSNGMVVSMMEDLAGVSPGIYTVIATDDNGCMAFDTVNFISCCELDFTCPTSEGGIFACITDVPAADTSIIIVNDFCDPLTIDTSNTDNGASGCVGDTLIITRTYSLTDGAGNIGECIQTFRVVDNVNPVLDAGTCPSDTTILCTENTDSGVLGTPTYTDNCTLIISTSESSDSTGFDGTCTNNVIGSISRLFFGVDDCGNVDSTCIQIISVIDTVAPTFIAPANITIQCTQDTMITTTGGVASATDNCGQVTITFSDAVTTGNCPSEDIITRTFMAEDDCGNTSTAIQIITRIDTVAPTFTLPGDITIQCDDSIDPFNTGSTSNESDNCGLVTISSTDTQVIGSCPGELIISRTWVATDDCNNSSSGVQTITTIDTVAPTFTVPPDTIIQCTEAADPAITGMVTDTADNCGNITLTFTDLVVSGICAGEDTIRRTWVASDECNNSNSQLQIIARIDTVGPVIAMCPADITVDCSGSLDTMVTGVPLASDNCSDVTISFSDSNPGGTCSSDSPVVRLFTVSDDCGNTATCSQQIVIQDDENPIVDQGTCPLPVTIDCTEDPNNLMVIPPTYSDNCSDPQLIIVTFSDDSTGFDGTCTNNLVGSILRTYFGTDICGNVDSTCTVLLAIQDTMPPTFTVPADTIIMCGMDTLPSTTGMVLDAADACQTVTVSFADMVIPGNCPAEDVTTRLWTVSDVCGNTSTGTQIITRIDSVGPTFTLPADTTINCTQDSLPVTTGMITDAADNCSEITTSFTDISTPGNCLGESTISRTWVVADACGNSTTGVQTISKIDTTGPTFTVPIDLTIACDVTPTVNMTGDVTDATDDCSMADVTFSDVVNMGVACPVISSIERTWTVADNCGNTTTGIQTIMLIDNEAPFIDDGQCPADITIDCADLIPTNDLPVYDDNCGMVVVTFSDNNMIMAGDIIGTITRTFFGTDDCGNVDSSCVQVLTVVDNEAPQFTFCPSDITIETCPPDADTSFTGVPLYVDNCFALADIILTIADDSMGITPLCFQGTIIRTFTVIDPAGNSNSDCVQNIMVNDTTGPVFNAPADTLVNCTIDLDDITLSSTVTDVSDCSSILDTSFTDVMGMMGCDGMGEVFRIWMVSDGCGNIGVDTQLIMVQDTFAPSLIVPADVIISCEQDAQDTSITGSMLNISDACSMQFMIEFEDDISGLTGCNGTGTIIRTWFASDDCANLDSMSQIITIVDTTAPTAVCQDIMIDFDNGNTIMPNPMDADNGSTDNCGMVSFTLAPASFDCQQFATVASLPAVLTVTDDCGNSSTCDIQVLGSGGGGVNITCPNDIVVQLGPGQCDRIVNYEIMTSPVCGGGDASVEQTDDTGLTSGDPFPIGTTIQTYIAYDDFGDTAMCSFNIIVIEYPGVFNPTCNDTLNISLDQNCEAIINPEIILEGEDFGCGNSFIIEIVGIGTDTGFVIVSNPELGIYYQVSISDPESGLSCWGHVVFEDKIPPVIECMDVELSCLASAEPVLGAPVIGILTVNASPGSQIGPDGGSVTTQTFDLVAPANAQVTDVNLTLDLMHTFSSDLDVFLIGPDGTAVELATDLCGGTNDWSNVTFDDEAMIAVTAACNPLPPALTGPVQPEGSLSDLDGTAATGTWTLMITDDAGGDQGILNSVSIEVAYLVALPYAPIATDGCGNVTLTFEDSASGEDCEASMIVRTWTAVDGSGNSSTCTQTITILPLELATLEFPENYLGECGGSTSPTVTGFPTLNGLEIGENQCNIFTTFTDKPIADCGGGTKIIRKWTVLDWCTQEIVNGQQIIKLTDNEGPVITCPANIDVSTDFWFCYANVSIPTPTVVDACGTPFTLELSASSGIVASFGNNFVVNQLALGAHTITWTATDDCGNSSSCSFEINVMDIVPPVPNCDFHTVVSLTNDGPKGLTLVNASVFDDDSYDNCSEVTFRARRMDSCIDFDWTTNGAGIDDDPNGIVNSRDRGTVHRPMVPFACCDVPASTGSLTGGVSRAPIMVELEVTDASGNVNYCMVEVEVQDKLAPLIICPPDIQVSCDFWFPTDFILNQFIPLTVDPLSNIFGTVLDAYENIESNRQNIIINDPGNNNLPQPYNWGKDGWANDNCNVDIRVRTRIIDDCSGNDLPAGAPSNAVRFIERTFRATDNQGNVSVCRQIIYVIDYKPFFITDQTCFNANPNDGVIWPCDELYTTCPDEVPVNEPTLFDDNCSQIGVTYKDTRFDFVDGACYKILREWRVIDWCQYLPASQGGNGQGLWTYTQVIKVIDSNGPVFIDCPEGPVTLCVENEGVSLPENNQVFLGEENPLATKCSVHVMATKTVEEFCSESVIYDVKVYPFNGAEFIQLKNKTTIAVDENGQAVMEVNTKTAPQLAVRLNGLPYNSPFCNDYHRVLWTVEDGCGNISTCEYLLRLEDCKQPSPVCINGISTVVMPSNGEITLWAKEYNVSSIDDCTASDQLLFSFSGDTYQPSMTYTCENVPAFDVEFPVQVWVADGGVDHNCNGQISWAERNKDFCTTSLVITDNDNVCDGSGSLIAGEIMTHDSDTPVELTTVTLQSTDNYFKQMVTVEDGQYEFNDVPEQGNYTITPTRNDNHKNGVSTLDLVRIQKHLLGVQPFTTSYQYIAADANNSESVSALDLVEIRKLILGIFIEYPSNKSWRFVETQFEFADASNPWPFNEQIAIDQLTDSNIAEDFMAIKIGDLNNTVVANANEIVTRSARSTLEFNIEDREVRKGEVIEVPVYYAGDKELLGYQFTMETPARMTGSDRQTSLEVTRNSFGERSSMLKFKDIIPGIIDMSDQNVAVHKGAITMSWHKAIGQPARPSHSGWKLTANSQQPLYTLIFEVQQSGKLSNMLSITSDITEAEGYDANENIYDIKLDFNANGQKPKAKSLEFELFQNEPNPFIDNTVISFSLPVSTNASFRLYNVTGKLVKDIQGDYHAGLNKINISKSDLPTAGIYYYTLIAGNYTATKKMIIN